MGINAAKNTDREIWREKPDDYYSNSIHVTEGNGIGMNVGGHVIVLRTEVWHGIAGKFISERAIAESQAPPIVGMCARLKDEWFPLHQKPHKQLDNCLDWKPVSSETTKRELGDGEPSPPSAKAFLKSWISEPVGPGAEWSNSLACDFAEQFAQSVMIAAQLPGPEYRCASCGEFLEIGPQDETVIHFKVCKCRGAAQEVSPRIISRETFPELGGETTVEVFEEVSPPSPPRETDGHPVGWCCKHCYDGGYQAAMRLLAEGDTRELKAALEEARIKLLQHLTPSPEGHFRRAKTEDVDWYLQFEAKVSRLLG